mmetsp:Transcript_28634/g.92375  ORF Transcript_28634/g.92375 Transcript_28634/m.92375 type:complete len:206 (-) Transcript_28634:387-1004(-)
MPGGGRSVGSGGMAAQGLLLLLVLFVEVNANQQKSPQEELKAKISAIHALSQTYLKKVPQSVMAVHANHVPGQVHATSMQAFSKNQVNIQPKTGMKLASATPSNADAKDPRMNNGKFDWLLKETSPLYTAAKKAVSVAANKLSLNAANTPKGALQLQASNGTDANTTETNSQGDRRLENGGGDSDDITSEFKMTKKNELYFFITY